MDPSTKARIETLVASSPIFVFMKGSKLMPQCGFSNNVVQILHSLGVAFETFDVLSDPEIRQGIKEFSSWPTYPPGVCERGIHRRFGHPDRDVQLRANFAKS
jgi:monothiol glutaredoxin